MLAYVKQNNTCDKGYSVSSCMPDTQMPQEVHHLQGAGEYIDKSQCFWGLNPNRFIYSSSGFAIVCKTCKSYTCIYLYIYYICISTPNKFGTL